jgi:hypothetical protein
VVYPTTCFVTAGLFGVIVSLCRGTVHVGLPAKTGGISLPAGPQYLNTHLVVLHGTCTVRYSTSWPHTPGPLLVTSGAGQACGMGDSWLDGCNQKVQVRGAVLSTSMCGCPHLPVEAVYPSSACRLTGDWAGLMSEFFASESGNFSSSAAGPW